MKRYMSGVWEHTVYICANRDRLGLYAELQISFGIVCAVTVKTQFTYCKKISRKGRYSSIRVETVQKKWYEIKKFNTKIVFEFTKPKQTSKRIWIFQKLQCVRKLIIKSAKTDLGCILPVSNGPGILRQYAHCVHAHCKSHILTELPTRPFVRGKPEPVLTFSIIIWGPSQPWKTWVRLRGLVSRP